VARYRPNILVGGGGLEPFAEDTWQDVALGPHRLTVDGASLPPTVDMAAADSAVMPVTFASEICLAQHASRATQLTCIAHM